MGGGSGKGGSVKMDVNANMDSNNTFDIVGLDDIKLTTRMEFPDPIVTKGSNDFAITKPIVMENDINTVMDIKPIRMQNDINAAMDIKPVTLDFCLKLDFGGPPPMCIRRPYSHHFGITMFGVELLGLNFSGESQVIIDELPKRPQIAWGGEERGFHAAGSRHGEPSSADSGLHIRLD